MVLVPGCAPADTNLHGGWAWRAPANRWAGRGGTGRPVPPRNWVLLDACRQLAQWCRAGAVDLRLAVNVSPRQLSDGGFAQTMLSVLEETGLPADALDLEITEVA